MPTRSSSPPATLAMATVLGPGSLTPDRFAEFATWNNGPCVTLMGAIDEGARRAPEILLKDLARVAGNELAAQGAPTSVVTELLASGSLRHVTFEDESIGGIAMLAGPRQTLTVAMRTTPPALANVGERFVMTPLLAEVVPAITYHLLALSQHRVRLFRGNANRLEPVRVTGMPRRLEALAGHQRMRRGHGAERTAGVHHGGGSDRDLHLDRLRQYFRDVDDAVAGDVRATQTAPLIVAGVGHELSIYRDVSRVEPLVTIEVGNPDRMSAAALFERCAPTIEDVLDRPRRAGLRDALESGTTLRSLPEIVDASAAGRVDTLFIQPDRLAWAAPRSGGSAATAERHAGDVEWHTEIIGHALLHGGRVFAAQPGELPEGVSAVASVRY